MLKKFISVNSKKKWDKVFGLIASAYKEVSDEEIKSGVYVIRNAEHFKTESYDGIKKFTPQNAQKLGEDFYLITGCGSFSKSKQRLARLNAFYENGSWYFSEILGVGRYYSDEPFPCKH